MKLLEKRGKAVFLFLLFAGVLNAAVLLAKKTGKDPVFIEVLSKSATIEDALMTAKNVLQANKFIAVNGIQKATFTATRTTASKADYYVADVIAAKDTDKVKISITFVKVGTGLMNLGKTAEKIKRELEGK